VVNGGIKLQHNKDEIIYCHAQSRTQKKWTEGMTSWEEFVNRLAKPKVLSCTIEQYQAMSQEERGKVKDCGGYVAGTLRDGERKKENVKDRTMITLDNDEPSADFLDRINAADFALVVHSTASHTAGNPRYRLIAPLERPVNSEEYEIVAHAVAKMFGKDQFDKTTYQPERLMYWPAHLKDAKDHVFRWLDKPLLNPDEILIKARQETGSAPSEKQRKEMKVLGDPCTKPGLIGAFNRTFCLQDAIDEFLCDYYQSTDNEDRYQYMNGEGGPGLVLYPEGYAYSFHSTDPAHDEHCHHAFDLCRIHLFGDRDIGKEDLPIAQLPSQSAMLEFAETLEQVKEEYQESGDVDRNKNRKTKHSDLILKLVSRQKMELFHDENMQPAVMVSVNGHMETHYLDSEGFRHWLTGLVYEATGRSLSGNAYKEAAGVLAARAVHKGQERKLALRVAAGDGAIYYDLANSTWQVVKIVPGSWSVENIPGLFRRAANTAPQMMPERGGRLDHFLKFMNLPSEADRILLQIYLVAALVPNIPHPVPIIAGEKGSAKSTAMRLLRRLIDPARMELLLLAESRTELVQMISNNYACFFDNTNGLTGAQSDILCCAVTGAGLSKRSLYTNNEDTILPIKQCVAINGIHPAATRADLLDRVLPFELERITGEARKTQEEIDHEFEKIRPSVFGAMLDALAGAMAIYPTVKLAKLPRMADFGKWGYAIAEACGIGGQNFLAAYADSQKRQGDVALEHSPVATAIIALMEQQREPGETDHRPRPKIVTWEGTPTQLLEELHWIANDHCLDPYGKQWPKSANALTRRMKEVKSNLESVGITWVETKSKNARGIKITAGIDEGCDLEQLLW